MANEKLRKLWEQRVADFKASGQTALAWCAAHDLKPHQLWYWIGKYKITSAPVVKPSSQWLSLDVSEPVRPPTENTCIVRMGRATIEVRRGFDPQLLSEVVRALSAL